MNSKALSASIQADHDDHHAFFGRISDQSRVFFANPLVAPSRNKQGLLARLRSGEAVQKLISDINLLSKHHPITLYWAFMGSRAGTFFVFLHLLPFCGILQGPELAAGWVAARVTCKLRQPANLALAGAIAHVCPAISNIKASAILGSVSLPSSPPSPSSSSSSSSSSLTSIVSDGVTKACAWVQGPVDKYGMAWYVSSKLTALSTLLGCSLALRSGVDVVALFQACGLSLALNEGVSGMAGAALLNTTLLPLHLLLAVRLTPLLSLLSPQPEILPGHSPPSEPESAGHVPLPSHHPSSSSCGPGGPGPGPQPASHWR